MGNFLYRARFARAVCDEQQPVRDISAWVSADPDLLCLRHVFLRGTVFHYAARHGKLVLLETLIRRVATSGPSHHAGQLQLQCLLNQKAGLDDTPLHLACREGHVEVVALLLQHGANPHLQDRRGANTALHLAAGHRTHSSQLVRVVLDTAPTFPLLHTGAARALDDTTPPPAAAVGDLGTPVTGPPSVAVQDLLEKPDLYGCTPLHRAVAMQNMDAMGQLLQAGACLSTRTRHRHGEGSQDFHRGSTPLHIAVQVGSLSIVLSLLSAHLARQGGTAAGHASDPRWLRDAGGSIPWVLSRRLQRPAAMSATLDPRIPLRDALQIAAPDAVPARVRSLQEVASSAHKLSLQQQLQVLLAAAGPVAHREGGSEQPSDSVDAAASELMALLSTYSMVCLNLGPQQRLALQLLQEQPREFASSTATGCCAASQRESTAIAAAGVPQGAGSDAELSMRGSLAAESGVRWVVRLLAYCVLCHGVCEPGQPNACTFKGVLLPSHNIACCQVPSRSARCDANTGAPPKAPACACPGVCASAGWCAPSERGVVLHAQYLSAGVCMCPSDCQQLGVPQLLHLLQHHRALQQAEPAEGIGAFVSTPGEVCGVCLEDGVALMVRLQPCRHMFCSLCLEMLLSLAGLRPPSCPMCRRPLTGFTLDA